MEHFTPILDLPQAFDVIMEMHLEGDEWESRYRHRDRQTLDTVLKGEMREWFLTYLEDDPSPSDRNKYS